MFFVSFGILFITGWGCGAKFQTVQESRVLMDTLVSISVYIAKPAEEAAVRRAMAAAFAEMSRLDSLMSAYRPDSEVALINREAATVGGVAASSDMDSVLQVAQWAAQISNGAFDVTVAPILRVWGFGTDSLGVPAPEKIAARLLEVDYQSLQIAAAPHPQKRFVHFLKPNMAIDLGGVAKGYAVDRGMDVLKKSGIGDALITAGGDLRAIASPFTSGSRYIWIRHPRTANPDSVRDGEEEKNFFGRFRLDAGAVSTSGDYERFFIQEGKRYHHIIDPHTGYPAARTVSATVIAKSSVHADALSTALFVLGPERGLALADSLPEVEAMILYQDGEKLNWRATNALKEKLEVFNLTQDAK
jgi:thiamine biosynthesis lipoprotein